LAKLADGAVLASIGETTITVAVTAAGNVREGTDFFPLTVDVEERMYAAGKIPGGFFRREGRASENAILTCRLIDRPLRPCFPDGFRNDVHVVAIVNGVDMENPYDILAINAASAALMLSGIPFQGPVGAVRIAHIKGEWVANPTWEQGEAATFEMVVAGRRSAEPDGVDVLMVEAGATEISLELVAEGEAEITEAVVADGLEFAKDAILDFIELQEDLAEAAGVKEQRKKFIIATELEEDVYAKVKGAAEADILKAINISGKAERELALDEIGTRVKEDLATEFAERAGEVKAAIRKLTKTLIRSRIVNDGVRIDGRGLTDIRQISAEVGLIPRVHGTGLFN
ncbi:MAG: polyribonucleotide nucleotidyltransferase, partial [Actinomycetota bacterium]